jgi:DNA-binding Xre family transcriptional regulator
MATKTLPKPLAAIAERIHHRFPEATIAFDAPSNPQASWFLDVNHQGHAVVVEWRRHPGFGVSTNPHLGGYGERADERYKEVNDAFKRVAALIIGRGSTMPPKAVRLRELRALRRISQVELAESLHVQQAAISRLERRKDILVSTLKAVVAAMGGELKVSAKFPDGPEREIQIADDEIGGIADEGVASRA